MRKSSVPEVDTEGIRNRIISETTLNLAEGARLTLRGSGIGQSLKLP